MSLKGERFLKNIKRYINENLIKKKKLIIFSSVLFFIGVVLGIFAACRADENSLKTVKESLENFVSVFFLGGEGERSRVLYCFLGIFRYIAVVSVCSAVFFLLPIMLIQPVLEGFKFGFFVAFFISLFGAGGILFAFFSMFFNIVFFYPLFLLLFVYSLNRVVLKIKKRVRRRKTSLGDTVSYITVIFAIAAVSFGVCFAESLVLPRVLKICGMLL